MSSSGLAVGAGLIACRRVGSWASSASESLAWRRARLTVASSSVRERSMMVRTGGVTGMRLKNSRSMCFERCTRIRGCLWAVGAVTSIGRPSQRSQSRSTHAA